MSDSLFEQMMRELRNADLPIPNTDGYPPRQATLADRLLIATFKAQGWQILDEPTIPLHQRFTPKTEEERYQAFEDYYDPDPTPKPDTYFRCVNNEMQVVEGDVYTCIALHLDSLLALNVTEPEGETEEPS